MFLEKMIKNNLLPCPFFSENTLFSKGLILLLFRFFWEIIRQRDLGGEAHSLVAEIRYTYEPVLIKKLQVLIEHLQFFFLDFSREHLQFFY